MAADLGPGDWVECINDAPSKTAPTEVRRGAIYCVESIQLGPWRCSLCGSCDILTLFGLRPARQFRGFKACRFRPIYRPNADFIASLNAPPKAAPRQPALPTRTPEVVGAGSRDAK